MRHAAVAVDRQQAEAHREQDHQHQPEPERGDGEPDHGEQLQQDRAAAAAHRGQHAERYADREREQEGAARQQQRRRKPLGHERCDGLAIEVGQPEIADDGVAQEQQVLDRERPVQREMPAQLGPHELGGRRRQEQGDRVAGRVRHGECREADAEQHRQRMQEARAPDRSAEPSSHPRAACSVAL